MAGGWCISSRCPGTSGATGRGFARQKRPCQISFPTGRGRRLRTRPAPAWSPLPPVPDRLAPAPLEPTPAPDRLAPALPEPTVAPERLAPALPEPTPAPDRAGADVPVPAPAACLRGVGSPSPGTRGSVWGRGPTLRTTGASDLSSFLAGVLSGYSQRSAMMHFGHAGSRATHT